MAEVLTSNQNYYDIANTIRQMKNVNTTYKPREMASALKDIYSNEVEGLPPLSFEANGNNLLNYRIDGASGGVGERTNNLFDKKNTEIIHAYFTPENLWQFNEDSSSIIIKVQPNTQYTLSIGTAISIFRIYKTSLENPEPGKSNVFTPIIRSSNIKTYTFTTDNDTTYIIFQGTNADTEMWINSLILNIGSTSLPSYEPYGYKVPVVVSGKNLLQNTATSQTINGVTFTVNNDKSITCNGTSSATTTFAISIKLNSNINYVLSGSPKNGGAETYRLDLRNISYSVYNNTADNGNGINFTVEENGTYLVCIRIAANYTCNNLTFYPMIRLSSIEDGTYEQYIEPTTTNIYIDKPIEAKANIPSEYTEVEYLESTGTQYINTGFKLNTNCRIVFDYYLTDLVSFSPFGSYQTQNQIGFTAYTTDNTTRFGTFVTRRLTGNYNHYQINNRTHFEYSKNGLYQNGSLVYSITTNDAVSNYNCFIFARNVDDVATGFGNIRMYYFKIYDNDSLVRNLIPCYRKSDNVAGLYDLVNSTFYTNEGTGNFIVGPIKENESISLSDTNKNIPTIDGTNTLTINTTIQPSNVYVQAPKDSIEATMIANALEEI